MDVVHLSLARASTWSVLCYLKGWNKVEVVFLCRGMLIVQIGYLVGLLFKGLKTIQINNSSRPWLGGTCLEPTPHALLSCFCLVCTLLHSDSMYIPSTTCLVFRSICFSPIDLLVECYDWWWAEEARPLMFACSARGSPGTKTHRRIYTEKSRQLYD